MAKQLLAGAAKLRAGAAEALADNAPHRTDAFRSKVFVDTKQRSWEFLPEGSVRLKGSAWGSWEWAKPGDDYSLIIYSGGAGKADNPMLVRLHRNPADEVQFVGFEEKFEAKLKP